MKEITIDGVAYILTPKKEEKREVKHEYVDLGLPSGRLWATCNIGAEKPTDCGNYFAWGAIEPYNLNNCDTNNYENTEASKLTEMNDTHDTAKVLWGKEWRMPNLTDFTELFDFCNYRTEEIDSILCSVFLSKVNDNKLIIPIAGNVDDNTLNGRNRYGNYWSRLHDSSVDAWSMYVSSSSRSIYADNRFRGFSVRPVRA